MRYIFNFFIIYIFSCCFLSSATAQTLDPVAWHATVNWDTDSIFSIVFTATIQEGWHIYSQKEYQTAAIAPTPTTFTFEKNPAYEMLGETIEDKGIEKYDPVFEMAVAYFENQAIFTQKIKRLDPSLSMIKAEVLYGVCDAERCLAPDVVSFSIALDKQSEQSDTAFSALSAQDFQFTESLKIPIQGWDEFPKEKPDEKQYGTIFFLGFIGGLLAILTPCVFPMIPLTVSFFTKGAANPKTGLLHALLYGFFIFAIYLLLSIPFHLLDSIDPEILNTISTNIWLNLIFFAVFVVFAFSFFGFFELALPASWGNRLDQRANSVGGILGVFFMALTLALVSFSCTGPILGSLLGGSLSNNGGAMQLSFGMGGFGLALALPFGVFAGFPNWLQQLPKSGSWLHTMKVILGFLELALALKFLSNADLVAHWGLLKRELFIGIWVIIGILMVLYLFGKIRFPHDSKNEIIGLGRKALAILVLCFVGYLLPGVFSPNANLNLLSGFPPPTFYSFAGLENSGHQNANHYVNFEAGLQEAKNANKPILLDFTGWACVNCRKMEEQVWSQPQVKKLMQDAFVVISLYVDDREKLPEDKRFSFKRPNGKIKPIRTIGDKWATFQTVNFQNNSQPFYVLLDTNLNLLNHTKAYTPNAEAYRRWLHDGLERFKQKQAVYD